MNTRQEDKELFSRILSMGMTMPYTSSTFLPLSISYLYEKEREEEKKELEEKRE